MLSLAVGSLQAVCHSNEGLEAILGTDSAYELWVRFGSEGDEAASLINGLEAAAGARTVSCICRHAWQPLVQSSCWPSGRRLQQMAKFVKKSQK